MPLAPNTPIETITADDRTAMTDFTTTIYAAMDGMCTSPYDRPAPHDRTSWTATDQIACLVYQSARDLAQPAQPFHATFERPRLRNEAGRREALARIRGLAMLVRNLIVNYTLMPLSNVVRRIEAVRPARDPGRSPVPEVRRKWRLEHMELGDLRKTVLDRQRRGAMRRSG